MPAQPSTIRSGATGGAPAGLSAPEVGTGTVDAAETVIATTSVVPA
jgi:hypothetical protein